MEKTDINAYFLEHYGVPGMKWGVRRARGALSRVWRNRKVAPPKREDVLKAKKRRKDTKNLINDLIEEDRIHAKKKNAQFDEKKQREYWERLFDSDLNATARTINKERIAAIVTVAAAAILIAS